MVTFRVSLSFFLSITQHKTREFQRNYFTILRNPQQLTKTRPVLSSKVILSRIQRIQISSSYFSFKCYFTHTSADFQRLPSGKEPLLW